jgi:hypothetical protein
MKTFYAARLRYFLLGLLAASLATAILLGIYEFCF